MPKPNGWTNKDVNHRDAVAEALIKKGYTTDQAYAIATAQIIKQRGLKP